MGQMEEINNCTVVGVFVAPVSVEITTPGTSSANQHPKSAFALYYPGVGCGGWGSWLLVYITYGGDLGYWAATGAADSATWVAEPVVEFYWQET